MKINRGGLCRIKEATFNVFLAIEEELKECLKTLTEMPQKDEIIQRVTANDDVEFYWLIATANFEIDEREVHLELLHKIVELYVTVRGFSFASAWLEKYKQRTKRVHNDQRVFVEICMRAVCRLIKYVTKLFHYVYMILQLLLVLL